MVRLGVISGAEVDQLFSLADKDKNGNLSYVEFASMLQDPYSRLQSHSGQDGAQPRPIPQGMDAQQYAEHVELMPKLRGGCKRHWRGPDRNEALIIIG